MRYMTAGALRFVAELRRQTRATALQAHRAHIRALERGDVERSRSMRRVRDSIIAERRIVL